MCRTPIRGDAKETEGMDGGEKNNREFSPLFPDEEKSIPATSQRSVVSRGHAIGFRSRVLHETIPLDVVETSTRTNGEPSSVRGYRCKRDGPIRGSVECISSIARVLRTTAGISNLARACSARLFYDAERRLCPPLMSVGVGQRRGGRRAARKRRGRARRDCRARNRRH